MADDARILVLGPEGAESHPLVERLKQSCPVVVAASLEDCLQRVQQCRFTGLVLLGRGFEAACRLMQSGEILNHTPDGIALLDQDSTIRWCNPRLAQLADALEAPVGQGFYDAFGNPEILGPDFCPFHTALGTGDSAKSTLRVGEKTYYEVHATPLFEGNEELPDGLVVIVRDLSADVLLQQKLNAIHRAGLELGDLAPDEILEMTVEQRIELLKEKIIHFTKDVLEFETVEIRLLDERSKQLEPLLVVGMGPDAANRQLYADPQENGVTGFVAATGKSYLCEDTENDPLYLPGAPNARSSLTVPLILHDEILGTFNVESPRPGAFDENDLQFLELFSREVAVALNTLELLVAEKLTTATESTELMLREVACPVDEILNDTAWILERYIGHDPNVCERLQRILKQTRDIKQVIQKVGESIAPKAAHHAAVPARPERPKLRSKRILVVDSDETVRQAAHELLGRYGCDVETAHDGEEALLMARTFHYDAVIADIRLPDMTGFECFQQIREIHEHLPVILMTGFGYDPSHSIVKARQMGLKSVLYKPFRLDQLLTEVENSVASPADVANESSPVSSAK